MGIIFQDTTSRRLEDSSTFMNLDVRDQTLVWIVCRRESRNEYHFQGVACAMGDKSAEEVAREMCRDENYYIFPCVLNVSLPHKAIVAHGLYFPLQK